MPRSLKEQIAELAAEIIHLKRELRSAKLGDFQRSEKELALANAEEALTRLRAADELQGSS